MFVDEVSGFAFNQLSEEQWTAFAAYRSAMDEEEDAGGESRIYPRPAVHMHEYGKNAEGYWTAMHMVALTKEFLILFEWLYPGRDCLLNVDWSSNHDAIAPDALTLSNLFVGWGGKNAKVLKPQIIENGCINPNRRLIPGPWKAKM